MTPTDPSELPQNAPEPSDGFRVASGAGDVTRGKSGGG